MIAWPFALHDRFRDQRMNEQRETFPDAVDSWREKGSIAGQDMVRITVSRVHGIRPGEQSRFLRE
jgi:hypothetical protein